MTALRVAVLAESETDDAVAREVVAHVRFEVVDSVPVPSLRARGWPAILQQLPAVVRTVYYAGDANALVILADTDHAAPHDPSTHTPDTPYPGCRWCLLHGALTREIQKLGARPMGIPLWTAIGTPVPAVEAEAYGPVPRSDKVSVASHLIRRALATPGLLRTTFPGGYGPLEDAIRAW